MTDRLSPVIGRKVIASTAVALSVLGAVSGCSSSNTAPKTSTDAIVEQHALAQEGFAIALASTVLQSQLNIVFSTAGTAEGSPAASACSTLDGGSGSSQTLPVNSNAPTQAGVYYDANCTQPYVIGQTDYTTVNDSDIVLNETADYTGLTGTALGTLALTEELKSTGTGDNQVIALAGTGTFTPAGSGGTPVQLGLSCLASISGSAPIPCAGAIAQDFPSLNLSIGSVTPITLQLASTSCTENCAITFTSSGSTIDSAGLGALSVTRGSGTTLLVNGGHSYTSSTVTGSAATFSLFPPTPTTWTVTDTPGDQQFTITVVDNTTRNLTVTITQISTGHTLASGTVDQSGTGSITYSDGSTEHVVSWLLQDATS